MMSSDSNMIFIMSAKGRLIHDSLMKLALCVMAVFMASQLKAAQASIEGEWIYRGMLYHGHELPPRENKLELVFHFMPDGEDRVYWTRDAGKTFCERKGKYSWDGKILHDEITWVNPANHADCAQDPDMQLGRVTSSPLELVDNELRLHLPLGEDEVIYLFKRR